MKIFTCILLFCVSFAIHAGEALALESDLQEWTILTLNAGIGDGGKWRLFLEGQPRIGDDIQHIERLILRGALGYKLTSELTVHAGYGWTPLFLNGNLEAKFSDEHRLWQQLSYEQPLDSVLLVHRLRTEQRFIEGITETSNRIRYMLRGSFELGRTEEQSKYGVTTYNELFVNLNTTNGPVQGFDRDRIFLGPYLNNGPFRYEAGYLNEFAVRRNNDERMIHAIVLFLGVTF